MILDPTYRCVMRRPGPRHKLYGGPLYVVVRRRQWGGRVEFGESVGAMRQLCSFRRSRVPTVMFDIVIDPFFSTP